MTFMSKMYNYGFASKGELGALVIVRGCYPNSYFLSGAA